MTRLIPTVLPDLLHPRSPPSRPTTGKHNSEKVVDSRKGGSGTGSDDLANATLVGGGVSLAGEYMTFRLEVHDSGPGGTRPILQTFIEAELDPDSTAE